MSDAQGRPTTNKERADQARAGRRGGLKRRAMFSRTHPKSRPNQRPTSGRTYREMGNPKDFEPR